MPDGSRFATLHLAISDATGDSAIFEYLGRQTDRSPRPQLPGYDQFTGIRPATRAERILEKHRGHHLPAGYQPGRRQVRPGLVLRERPFRKPTTSESPPQAYSALSVILLFLMAYPLPNFRKFPPHNGERYRIVRICSTSSNQV